MFCLLFIHALLVCLLLLLLLLLPCFKYVYKTQEKAFVGLTIDKITVVCLFQNVQAILLNPHSITYLVGIPF